MKNGSGTPEPRPCLLGAFRRAARSFLARLCSFLFWIGRHIIDSVVHTLLYQSTAKWELTVSIVFLWLLGHPPSLL